MTEHIAETMIREQTTHRLEELEVEAMNKIMKSSREKYRFEIHEMTALMRAIEKRLNRIGTKNQIEIGLGQDLEQRDTDLAD